MKIYFGRIPNTKVTFLDDKHLFPTTFMMCDYNIEDAVDELIKYMQYPLFEDYSFYTFNPLIINYFTDEFANKYVYFVTETGEEIKMGDDESCQIKLKFMGPGDVVCDDSRVFSDNSHLRVNE